MLERRAFFSNLCCVLVFGCCWSSRRRKLRALSVPSASLSFLCYYAYSLSRSLSPFSCRSRESHAHARGLLNPSGTSGAKGQQERKTAGGGSPPPQPPPRFAHLPPTTRAAASSAQAPPHTAFAPCRHRPRSLPPCPRQLAAAPAAATAAAATTATAARCPPAAVEQMLSCRSPPRQPTSHRAAAAAAAATCRLPPLTPPARRSRLK